MQFLRPELFIRPKMSNFAKSPHKRTRNINFDKMKPYGILICGILAATWLTSCGTRGNKTAETDVETCFTAIDNYLTTVIGTQYSPGEICIPYHNYLAVDESDGNDIQVWGDFWVENYRVSEDTLVFVSGGNHPGKMHVKKDSAGHFSVTAFEEVGDGSTFLPTAKAIFGDKFDAFQKAYADHEEREKVRKTAIGAYVFENKLAVKVYKDYGWPAVDIPEVRK